ncbi:hypothetical protein [Actinoplanes sp. NPDC049802]|uniref:hypothetical protein n=1 Tax=Actinoplanes sp. NPDC049802 TaxID=3154742 RepID=UPI003406A2BD
MTAAAVAGSNSIEGFRVSAVDVQDLMDGEKDVEVSEENRAETLACQRMMTYVQTLHGVTDFTYSKGLLNALHWMLQGHRHARRKPASQWRGGPVYVTDPTDPSFAAYTASAASEVPVLMGELVAWLNAAAGAGRPHPGAVPHRGAGLSGGRAGGGSYTDDAQRAVSGCSRLTPWPFLVCSENPSGSC